MDWVNAAANVGSHFIVNNLLFTAFIMLWVNSRFWIAEVLLVVNLVNLIFLYFRHPATPPCKHVFWVVSTYNEVVDFKTLTICILSGEVFEDP